MEALVTIGEFSRLSHLTTKALRHYHDVGLLRPELIDSSGYRRYAPGQVQQAQLVRRLRLLDMPVPEIAAVLAAPDDESGIAPSPTTCNGWRTSWAAPSRWWPRCGRCSPAVPQLQVEYRTVDDLPVLGIRAEVRKSGIERWRSVAFPQLYEAVARSGVDPAGAGGATYDAGSSRTMSARWWRSSRSPSAQARPTAALAAGRFAVAVHAGAFDDIDISYGRLGSHVARDDQPLPLPIREHYLIGPNHTADPPQFRTEIWWPISATPPEEQETSPWQ